MSTLTLLVIMLLTFTGLLSLGALAYAAYRHPKLATPLMVAGTFAAVFIGAIAMVVTR
ncbi:hypothetical protein [Streptomyces sp. NPDC004266]|uniref:hypothetical protein n=1 Tax=Streptomyces sp. NPDC004266 TaxID=3364693 RepID=UPI0036BC28F8